MSANQKPRFADLLTLFGKHARVLLLAGLIGGLAMASWRLMTPREYTSLTLLKPLSPSGSDSGLGSSALGQLGEIGSLIGLSAISGDSAEPIAILESRELTEAFIERDKVLPYLFPRRWSARTGTWRHSFLFAEPTIHDGFEKFKKFHSVDLDAKSGFVLLSVTSADPEKARQWAVDLVDLTNESMRARARIEADRHIAFLRDQIRRDDLVEMQSALSTLIQAQVRSRMMADGNSDYAFKVLDAAFVPNKPSDFGLLVSGLIGLAAGLFMASCAVLLRAYVRGELFSE